MADEEQLARLLDGVEDWNRWREENPGVRIDLRKANLVGAKLQNADLRKADLLKADLRKAKLRFAYLTEAELSDTNLEQADLEHARISLAYLTKTNLRGANLTEANLQEANLQAADLQKAKLEEADLRRADLSAARFRGANLHRANLQEAKLSHADLQEANLWGAKLCNASLRGTDLQRADLEEADLQETDLRRASLREAKLRKANLQRANLREAKLEEADLKEAELQRANLQEAKLWRVNLQRANLQEAKLWRANLREADLRMAALARTDLSAAEIQGARLQIAALYRTLFTETQSLAQVKGLEKCIHYGPSTVDHQTLNAAQGQLPDIFLKGCGFQDWELLNAKLHNPRLRPDEVTDIGYQVIHLRTRGPIFTNALFISYTHIDSDFVDFIHKKLDSDGIRSWRDTHDMAAGPLEEQIDAAISANKTVLLVLSRNSMKSDWVEWEVEKARKLHKELKERGEDTHVLCPIAIDDSWEKSEWPGPLMTQLKKYNILDFSSWQQDGAEDAYQKLKRGIATYYDA